MLQILRKRAQSTFIQIIVVIIALVFIFWGVGANLSGDRQAALVVNGDEVSFQDFQQAYDRAYQRLSDQFGGNVPKGMAETFGIKQQVINQLIQTALLRQGAREMGVHVSSDEVRQAIEDMVQFQENGSFNMDRYKSVLSANKMAPTKFESSMKIDRLSEVAAREIGNFASVATDLEIEEIYSRLNEKIGVKFVQFSPENFEQQVVIDDETLQAWFGTVKDNYKTDPQIKLKYLAFSFDDVGKKIDVDEPKIKQYYQNNINRYKVPEQRHARHILLKASDADTEEFHDGQKAKAKEVLQLIKNGQDFVEMAKEYSEGPSKESGGDLGFFQSGQMVPAFNDAVFSMQAGDISDVVKTSFGYHIILLEEIKQATTKTLEEVRDTIITAIQKKEAETLAFQMANDAYEGIIGAGSLEKSAASSPAIEIKESDFFARKDAPKDLASDSVFLDKGFALGKGELSSLLKGQTGYAILYAIDRIEPEVPSIDSVKDKLTADYRIAKSKELAQTEANDFLASLKEGKDLDSVASDKGYNVLESGFLSQGGQASDSEFPESLIEDAFLLSKSAPLPKEVGQDNDIFYVYTFQDREIPVMAEDDPEEKTQYRDNLLNYKKQQLLAAWLRNLETDAEITRHQSL